jgi:FdhE protein
MTNNSALGTSLLDRKLRHLAGLDFIPPELLDLLAKVAKRQIEARETAEVEIPARARKPSPDRHLRGEPLLPASDFAYDHAQYKELFEEFRTLLAGTGGHLKRAAETIGEEIAAGRLDPEEAAARFLDSDQEFFESFAEKTPDAPSTLSFLVQAALTPSIEELGEQLAEGHDRERVWEHGTCPVCGGLPLIGRLKDHEGKRYLTCSFCRTEYRVPRIKCPFCGEDEQSKLLFFESPDEPGYRVDTCKSCKLYIKTADFRQLDRLSLPLLDDLESLPLDILARQEGYTRPTVSAWGF